MIDYMQVYTVAHGAEVVGELWTGNVTGRPCVARNMKVCSRAGLAEHGFTEHHVHAKGLAVELPGEPALCPEAQSLVTEAVVVDFCAVGVRPHLEDHEVSSATARARNRSNTSSWRFRAKASPPWVAFRRRCSSASLKRRGEE